MSIIPLEECTDEYLKLMRTLAKKFESSEIDFLEYQALTYRAIEDIVTKYDKRPLSKGTKEAIKINLLNLWIYGDRLIFNLEGPPYSDTHHRKLELIGEHLAKKCAEKRKA